MVEYKRAAKTVAAKEKYSRVVLLSGSRHTNKRLEAG
jgi:hypothetical protein